VSRSKLFVHRFVVYGNGKFVYDEEFHLGVNIIRGENGTGKSTIMDLINYGLGAEISDWTDEQRRCDWVAMEISLNGLLVTLKRNITDTGKEKITFFEGRMEQALKYNEGWQKYSMTRSKDSHSISQQLFELLALPRHKTDEDKNLTMHQILRMMYVDQLSSTTKLLKEDQKFDNVTYRKAIGEFLLGIDDLAAYNLRQELIEAEKEFEKVNGELKAIYRMFGHDESLINVQTLDNDILTLRNEITALEQKKFEIRALVKERADQEVSEKIIALVKKVDEEANRLSTLKSERNELQLELNETRLFLHSLEERKKALAESQITYSALGEISFKYCPSCLEPIEEHSSIDSCHLCKKPKPTSDKGFAYSQLLNELNFQIKESRKIINTFSEDVLKIDSDVPLSEGAIETAKAELKELQTATDEKEALLLNVSSEIGFCRSQILSLEDKREQVERVEALKLRKGQANSYISNIKDKLQDIRQLQEHRYTEIYSLIEGKAKSLLKADGGYEIAFNEAEEVIFDFAKDKMYVNGRSKFSASSMVVLKNSIRFAMFEVAVDDKHARLPNLLLMDNIEDKGMREERSQNFQRQIVDACNKITDEFQLIFTTSMIANELDDTSMCIGPSYPKGTHTLEF